MKTPKEWLSESYSYQFIHANIDMLAEIITDYMKENITSLPLDVSDSDIKKAAEAFKIRIGSVRYLREAKHDYIIGAREMRDGKIKSLIEAEKKLTKEEAMKVYPDLCFCKNSTYTKGVCNKCGKLCD